MKNYQPIIEENDNAPPLKGLDLFILSDLMSEHAVADLLRVVSAETSNEFKSEYVINSAKASKEIYSNAVFRGLLKEFFYVDGAVKLTPDDLQELSSAMRTVIKDEEGVTEVLESDDGFKGYIEDLLYDFVYQKGDNLVFRNSRYYFLVNGVKLRLGDRNTSINDYFLEDIEISKFCNELAANFNAIQQHLMLFSDFIFGYFGAVLHNSKEAFCVEVCEKLSSEKLALYDSILTEGRVLSGSKDFDTMYANQWKHTLDALHQLREIVKQFEATGSPHVFHRIIRFLARETIALERAKIEFGIDIDAIFNKFAGRSPGRAMRKVLLGLLDAKINLLAFCQNFVQILGSNQFLNPDFPGKLVFSQSIVKNIASLCPVEFADFKKLQYKIVKDEISIQLLREIDEHIGFYMDTLLEDNYVGYVKLMGAIAPGLPELGEERTAEWPSELRPTLEGLHAVFNLLDSYVIACENREDKRQAKNIAAKKNFKRSDLHLHARLSAIKKLIRTYREENDPIIMIKTAQNALNLIIEKGFDPASDILHVMSINYGGALVGSFAKHTFSRTVKRGRVLCNPGGLVYSIYDVKNANSFSGLVDYPFSGVLREKDLSQDIKEKFAKRNWLLVFDDNVNSGQTLDDIRMLAEQSGFYNRINLFPCRVSSALENYKKDMPFEEKILMLGTAAALARKSKLNTGKIRYKEKLGTIIGNRIFKILSAGHYDGQKI